MSTSQITLANSIVMAPSNHFRRLRLTFTFSSDVLGTFLLKNDFDDGVCGMVFQGLMVGTQAEQDEFVAVHVVILVKAFFFLNIIFFV